MTLPVPAKCGLLSIALGLCAAASPLAAQSGAPAASVVLVARMPETAGVRWNVAPVHGLPLENGQRADLVVLENTLHFALGQVVRAEARVAGADSDTALWALPSSEQIPPALFHSYLPRPAVKQLVLVPAFDPRRGRSAQVQGLLVTRAEDSGETTLRVTLTAF